MYATVLWIPKICKPLVVYRFYCMVLFHSQTRRHMINYVIEFPAKYKMGLKNIVVGFASISLLM